jgi:hypothetical protein
MYMYCSETYIYCIYGIHYSGVFKHYTGWDCQALNPQEIVLNESFVFNLCDFDMYDFCRNATLA